MTRLAPLTCFLALIGGLAPTHTLADQVIGDDLIVSFNLCVGSPACVDGEAFGIEDIRIKSSSPGILFDDATHDWFMATDSASVLVNSAFSLFDVSNGTAPLVIEQGVPNNLVYVSKLDQGRLGLGTSMPQADIHVLDNFGIASLYLEAPVFPAGWALSASASGLSFADEKSGNTPLIIRNGAPDFAMYIADNGAVGLGTSSPGAPLELSGDDTFNFFRITATGAATNESVDITFTGGPLGTGQLRYNIVEVGDTPQVPEMTLDADGNMTLTGTLTTMGPTCAAGCDRVFDDGYDLPDIKERAEQMFAMGHLPALGLTQPNAPLNVGEKLGQVINELEHAHIYINQLHERDVRQEALIARYEAQMANQQAQMAALSARLEAVEAR